MMETRNEPQNLSTIVCYSSPEYMVLEKNNPTFKNEQSKEMIVINRKDNSIVSEKVFRRSKQISRHLIF